MLIGTVRLTRGHKRWRPPCRIKLRNRCDSSEPVEAGVHPIVVKIALAAVLWFLAVTWLAFAGNGGVDFDLTIVTLFFAIFFTLFLLLASFSVADPRWPTRQHSLREFLTATSASRLGP